MHYSQVSVAALSLALGASAVSLDPSLGSEADLPDGYNLCVEADNCEVFRDEDDSWSFRFVSGREPGSDWYVENVNSTAEVGPQQQERNLIDKRDSCDSSNGGTCGYIYVRPSRTLYGTILPRDAADSLWDNCYDFGCETGSWELDTRTGSNGAIGARDRKLKVTPGGVYDPEFRWPLIFSITEIISQMTETYDVSGGVPRHGTRWSATMHTAPYRVHVARFHNQYMQGDLVVHMDLDGSDGWGCSEISSALSTLAGYLNPMVGHALGMLGGSCA